MLFKFDSQDFSFYLGGETAALRSHTVFLWFLCGLIIYVQFIPVHLQFALKNLLSSRSRHCLKTRRYINYIYLLRYVKNTLHRFTKTYEFELIWIIVFLIEIFLSNYFSSETVSLEHTLFLKIKSTLLLLFTFHITCIT